MTSTGDEYVDLTVRVRYAETDQMGVAYYANHFVWFELGRTEFLRRRGHTYREIEEREGCYLVVAEARCRYRAPLRYDDQITIRTRLKQARTRAVVFDYEILTVDGNRVATGETMHVVTSRDGHPRSLPDRYLKALRAKASPVPS